MTELTISSGGDPRRDRANVSSYTPENAREEVGRVIEAGDGIARVEGLPSAMTNELLEFEGGLLGSRAEPRRPRDRCRAPGRRSAGSRRARVRRTGECSPCPWATASSAASSTRWARRSTASATIDRRGPPCPGTAGAHRCAAPAGEGAPADRPQGRRRHDADRPRPASADHRRPPDRQDRRGDRHDHQPEVRTGSPGTRASRSSASTSPIGQKGSTIAAVRGALEEAGALEYTTIVAAPASDPAGFKYLAPYTGSAIGQHWMYNGQARPDRLRRPDQAGRGLPGRVAAAAPPAGS